MSAPQTARERFEAWYEREGMGHVSDFDDGFAIWQAAERSAIERAAKVAEKFSPPVHSKCGQLAAQAIRSLITK